MSLSVYTLSVTMRLATLIIVFLMFTFAAQGQSGADSLAIAKRNDRAYQIYLAKPDSAISMVKQALPQAENAKLSYQIGYGYFILSKAHWAKTNYLLSIEFAFKALRIFETLNQPYLLGECYLSLGRTFADLKNYDQARVYIDKALSMAVTKKDSYLLAEAYREKSFLLLELNQLDSALWVSNAGIKLYEEQKDTLATSILFTRNSRIYFAKKDFKKSEEYNRKAIRMDQSVGNLRGLGVSYFQGAMIFNEINKTDSALLYLHKGLDLSMRIHNLSNVIRIHELMADIYQKRRNAELSISNLKIAHQYKDSLYNLERNGQIQEMRALYELEQQEKTIALLEKENAMEREKASNQQWLIVFFVIIILLLSGLVYIFWRMRRLQVKVNEELAEKNQEIALQNEEILSQAEALQSINQLKSKILSVIGHDLRGPINNLHALLELVTKKLVTPEEFMEMTVKLKSNLNVTQRALENLLNWSLGQMEGIKTEPVTFNIHSIIEDVAHLSEEAATRKQIILKADGKVPLFVEADVNQVHLILRNLFNNAIKFSKRDGQVSVSTMTKSGFCYINIEDQGIGMTKAEVQMILKSNEYFTKSGTDQEKGTGLGLLLCKDFIKRNGGDFFIESQSGSGTKIIFTLPLAPIRG